MHIGEENAYKILMGKPEGNKAVGRPRSGKNFNIIFKHPFALKTT
jgi:hypothetical protein